MENFEITHPNYSFIFKFEEDYVHEDASVWMMNNWTTGFYICGIYLILIFGGQHYMRSRPPFELRGLLSLWNAVLAVFSIIGACRTAPEFFHTIKNYGLYHSTCNPSFLFQDRVSGFWSWMFALSKLPELGDTAFIVLRKQPLIFLHWYHHITVLLYSWYSFAGSVASGRWFVVMNYCVHSLMYCYYALRSMRYSPPRSIAMAITLCQLLQMVFGCAVNIWIYQILESGQLQCNNSHFNVKLSLAMYLSYFILFVRFFHKAYFGNRKKSKPVASISNITSRKYDEYKAKVQ